MPDQIPERTIPEVGIEPEPAELPDELIDELLAGAKTPEEIAGPDGLLNRLTKRLIERAMDAELSEHLGYERGQAPPGGTGNTRNGPIVAQTIRRRYLTLPGRITRSARRATLHLPARWPWRHSFGQALARLRAIPLRI